MQRNDVVKGVFIVVPLAVLCLLYGLWIVMDTPVYVESMIVGGIVLLLYALLYIRFVPRAFEFVMGVDQDEKLTTVQRTSTVGARELLRLILMLAIGRGLFMLGAFLWSLYLNGYTETAFEIQHIWADHMFAERIISIANKGYAAETVNQAGKYYNLLFPPLYSWIVRLTSPVYLSSIRAGFFLSNLNAILSGIVLYLLVMYDHDRRSAVRALWYYSILPPSFLLTCTIPASTFLLFSLICVYCARRKLFMISSLFGAMAALTDRLGIVLVIPLLIEFFNSMTKEYRSLKEVTWRFYLRKSLIGSTFMLVPLGFIIYLIINRVVGGSMFAYVSYVEELFDSHFALFYRTCGVMMERLIDSYRAFQPSLVFGLYLPSLLCAVGSLVLILIKGAELRVSYLAFFMVCLPVILSQTGVMDAPRQLFCCFPVIIVIMSLTKNRLVDLLASLVCIAGSVAYLGMYVAGWPVV